MQFQKYSIFYFLKYPPVKLNSSVVWFSFMYICVNLSFSSLYLVYDMSPYKNLISCARKEIYDDCLRDENGRSGLEFFPPNLQMTIYGLPSRFPSVIHTAARRQRELSLVTQSPAGGQARLSRWSNDSRGVSVCWPQFITDSCLSCSCFITV